MSFGLCSPRARLIFQPADSLPCTAHFVLLIYLCIPPPEQPLCEENHLLPNLIPFKWLIFSLFSSFFLNLMRDRLVSTKNWSAQKRWCHSSWFILSRWQQKRKCAALKVLFTPQRDKICYISCGVDQVNGPTSLSCHRDGKIEVLKAGTFPASYILIRLFLSLWPSNSL